MALVIDLKYIEKIIFSLHYIWELFLIVKILPCVHLYRMTLA